MSAVRCRVAVIVGKKPYIYDFICAPIPLAA